MRATVIYGNQHEGNTYRAAQIFKDGLLRCGAATFIEFFLPRDLPEFCIGCQLCLGGPRESCPHAGYVAPILDAVLRSDALIVASPHYGASAMPASLKNLFDHLDFLVLNVAPREEIFAKKAFVLTTGSGSASAAGEIGRGMRRWGINRVYSASLRMFTDKWDKMPLGRRLRFEDKLRGAARRFYSRKRRLPYLGTVGFYYLARFVLKKYVGAGGYPYEYWQERGWFGKRPF